MLRMLSRHDFRIVHASIQANHLHLLVEADDEKALAKGMQSFLISLARKLNAHLGRSGSVFPDRYHARVIDSRRQARHALAYVLEQLASPRRRRRRRWRACWKINRFSSAIHFTGFTENERWTAVPDGLRVVAGVGGAKLVAR